jgi:hypothetical protein
MQTRQLNSSYQMAVGNLTGGRRETQVRAEALGWVWALVMVSAAAQADKQPSPFQRPW